MPRESSIVYELDVSSLENVVAAHVHCAPRGSNGSVGVPLFSGGPTSINGTLAHGPIVATSIESDDPCFWEDLDDIIAAIRTGNAYVNVHTSGHPSGEIRGQID